jgi:protein SCO1
MRTKSEQRGRSYIAVAATVAAAVAGAAVLWHLTSGLSSFTSESWRRASVAESPRALPEAVLQDQQGRQFSTRDLCGKVVVVDFVYTRCPTVCKALGGASAQLAARLDDEIAVGDAMVLSISFDAANDTPMRMNEFKHRFERTGTRWVVARPSSDSARRALLAAFGVVAIPDGMGGYDHNAALHVVDKSCRLMRVLDPEDVDHAETLVRSLL